MSKQKEKSELEYLRSENRKLKSMNKNLKKQLSRTNKRSDLYHDLEDKIAEDLIQEELNEKELIKNDQCPSCFKGTLETLKLGAKKLALCDSCTYRKLVK